MLFVLLRAYRYCIQILCCVFTKWPPSSCFVLLVQCDKELRLHTLLGGAAGEFGVSMVGARVSWNEEECVVAVRPACCGPMNAGGGGLLSSSHRVAKLFTESCRRAASLVTRAAVLQFSEQ